MRFEFRLGIYDPRLRRAAAYGCLPQGQIAGPSALCCGCAFGRAASEGAQQEGSRGHDRLKDHGRPSLPARAPYPVLPLRDIVVFPHMIVPLFVGREKSIKALEEVMRNDTLHPARDAEERVRR